jgi:FkbM family methyltransferase
MKTILDKQRGPVAVLDSDSHYSKWVEEHKSLCTDRTVPDHLLPLIPVGGTVVDAGANIGTHTVQYAERVGSDGHVIAFEPYKPAFECLEFNCRNFQHVQCFNVGLAWQSGRARLVLPNDNNMGTVATDIDDKGSTEIHPLDDYNLEACDFIKLDVEGFEVLSLFGAANTIGKFRPKIYVELNDSTLKRMGRTKQDVLGFMERNDYSYRFLDRAHNMEMPQVDVLFEPK